MRRRGSRRHFTVAIDAFLGDDRLGRGVVGGILHDRRRKTCRDVLDALQEALEPATAEKHLALAAVEDTGEERALEPQDRQHAFFDCALGYEAYNLYGLRLTEAVHTANPLLQHCWIPG